VTNDFTFPAVAMGISFWVLIIVSFHSWNIFAERSPLWKVGVTLGLAAGFFLSATTWLLAVWIKSL
jgi:hypothetical protein